MANIVSVFSQAARQICADVIFMSGIAFLLLYWLTPLAVWAQKLHLGTAVLAVAWILMLSPISIHGKLKTLAIRPLERAGKLDDPMSNILKMGMGCTFKPVVLGKVNNNVI